MEDINKTSVPELKKPYSFREIQAHFGSYFKAQMAICQYVIEGIKPDSPEDWDWQYIEENFFVTNWSPLYVAWQQLLEMRKR